MVDMPVETKNIDMVVRSLSSAGKSLRLYPATSPIPRQSVEAAESALNTYFETEGGSVLPLQVVREGLVWCGQPIGGSSGGSELADQLREHGVAEIDIVAGCSAEELLVFLDIIGREPSRLRSEGGVPAVLAGAGVELVRVTDVHLTVLEQVAPAEDEDVEDFLRKLIEDPEKLSAWFGAASSGDPHAFEEGLMELVRVSGPSGYESLLEALGGAFVAQSSDGKDALLGLALDPGPTRDLAGGMFKHLSSNDIAGSVLGGTFGKNMLSLSTALTHLPLDQVAAQVRAEVQAMLPGSGHTTKESHFLQHMIEVRESTHPEPSLIDADATYRSVAESARLSEEMIARARGAVAGSAPALSAASVRTMLTLLDQQNDFDLFCQTATSLAGMVPRLIEQGDLTIALHVLTELSNRGSTNTGPWPDLSARMRDAIATATGPRSMSALVRAVAQDRTQAPTAKSIVRLGGESTANAVLTEAVSLKAEGLEIAEELLGRSVIDHLNRIAPQAQWFQLSAITTRLARDYDPRSTATIEALMRRPDEQSRREVAVGLAAAAGPVAARLLPQALRDPSTEVAIVAAKAIARSDMPNAGALIGARLGELDVDGNDFALGRELVVALARIPGADADAALSKLAGRRAIIKRGHFSEVQHLVNQAITARAQGGAR